MNGLFFELNALVEEFNSQLPIFIAVFVRVGAAVSLLPALGDSFIPNKVKISIILCMTFLLSAALYNVNFELSIFGIINEAVIGLVLGFGLRILIFTLQTAGHIAAQSISLSQMFSNAGPDPQPIISNIFVLAGVTLFLIMGGLEKSFILLLESYKGFPVGHVLDSSYVTKWGVKDISYSFNLAFSLAAPFVIASLLYNLALGAINKALPQLMVVMIGAPALAWGGILMLIIFSPVILDVWSDIMIKNLLFPLGP